MQLSDRNSRMLLVITIIGVLSIIYRNINNLANNKLANSLYIYRNCPLGGQHFIVLGFLTALIYLIMIGILYCTAETHNFVRVNIIADEVRTIIENFTENIYKFFLVSFQVLLFIVLEVMAVGILLSKPSGINKVIGYMMVIFLLIFFVFYCCYGLRKFFKDTKETFENIIGIIILYIFIGGIILSLFTSTIGNGLTKTCEIEFSDRNNVSMQVTLLNRKPSNMKLIVIGDKDEKRKEVSIDTKELDCTGLVVLSVDGEDNKVLDAKQDDVSGMYSETKQEYTMEKNLEEYLMEGENTVIFYFTIDKRIYKIVNKINKSDKKFEIKKKAFKFKLK
ncbi:hypothetical protein [Crassaminicella profunda]|uniref:hypothetical protein n=1 Tax=Crassaminicella profunda TaxID=1286698 RepID=UPI001CA7A149|nr:hypothetical protein [Crassaminicella profunda]QZY56645.1 hypothetical protein K7H06_06920 [Crassaminicella profunda]